MTVFLWFLFLLKERVEKTIDTQMDIEIDGTKEGREIKAKLWPGKAIQTSCPQRGKRSFFLLRR